MSDTAEEKRKLRHKMMKIRNALPKAKWRLMSANIRAHLYRIPTWQKSRHVAVYHSISGEVETPPLMEQGWQEGKTIYLPKVDSKEHRLYFYRIDSLEQLKQAAYGIPEPTGHEPQLQLEKLDCLIVPGLAFDRLGYRLGYGGGYYDRFLSCLPIHIETIGLAFQCQIVEQLLPRDHFDMPVKMIVTERGLWHCAKR